MSNNGRAASVWDFYMHMDVDACDCTQGLCERHETVCTGSRLWEKNLVLQWGVEPVSVLHLAFQSDACTSPNACALFCMVWSVPLYLCCCNANSEGHKTSLLLIHSKWMCFDLASMGFYFMGPLKKKKKLYNFYRCQCYLYGWSILLLSELTCTFKCNIM